MTVKQILFCSLFAILLISNYHFLPSVKANSEDQEHQEHQDEHDEENEEEYESDEPQHQHIHNMQEQQKPTEQQQEEQRNIVMSCVILSKHKSHRSSKEFQQVGAMYKNSAEQTKYFRKINAELIEACYKIMDFQTSQKFMENIQAQGFDTSIYEYVYKDFDLQNYLPEKNPNLQLTQFQDSLLKFQADFDKHMQDRRDKEEEEEEASIYKSSPEDMEPKIGGFSFGKSAPFAVKAFYVVGIAAIFVGLIFFAIKELGNAEPLGDKVRKERKLKKQKQE